VRRDRRAARRREVGDAKLLWHRDSDLSGVDAVVVPGGFSYGDYLRVGAIARPLADHEAVADFARSGGPVLGICNGFQVLCEAGLLPGALLPNLERRFICRQLDIEVADTSTAGDVGLRRGCAISRFRSSTRPAATTRRPTRSTTCASSSATPRRQPERVDERHRRVANAEGNVVGLMPHPEHAVDELTGSADGLKLFESVARVLA
jgi:phosphoribosylformylglycinamidine synthase